MQEPGIVEQRSDGKRRGNDARLAVGRYRCPIGEVVFHVRECRKCGRTSPLVVWSICVELRAVRQTLAVGFCRQDVVVVGRQRGVLQAREGTASILARGDVLTVRPPAFAARRRVAIESHQTPAQTLRLAAVSRHGVAI